MDKVRSLVSKKKRRFKEGDFNLDLSYVTDRLIAMGYPSEGVEAGFRNALTDVQRFLDTFHPNRYWVYNLCSERAYDPSKFNNCASRYPFDDHNPPPLDMLLPFCEDLDAWFKRDAKNVALIHCKAGKGRTGVMICAWLVFARMWDSADEALLYYSAARTLNQKGITIPSQIRYVKYFHQVVSEGGYRSVAHCCLKRLRLPVAPYGVKDMHFVVHLRSQKLFTSSVYHVTKEAGEDLSWDVSVPLVGDAVITLYSKGTLGGDSKFARFWFHTSYLEDGYLVLSKSEIDKVCKDKKHKAFPQDFAIECIFDVLEPAQKPQPGSYVGTGVESTDNLHDGLDEGPFDDDEDEESDAGGGVGGEESTTSTTTTTAAN